MDNKDKNKKEPWRIATFIISVIFIIFMLIKKDIAAIYSTMPKEQIAPMLATTVAVSLIKVGAIAGVVFLLKWLFGKIKKDK